MLFGFFKKNNLKVKDLIKTKTTDSVKQCGDYAQSNQLPDTSVTTTLKVTRPQIDNLLKKTVWLDDFYKYTNTEIKRKTIFLAKIDESVGELSKNEYLNRIIENYLKNFQVSWIELFCIPLISAKLSVSKENLTIKLHDKTENAKQFLNFDKNSFFSDNDYNYINHTYRVISTIIKESGVRNLFDLVLYLKEDINLLPIKDGLHDCYEYFWSCKNNSSLAKAQWQKIKANGWTDALIFAQDIENETDAKNALDACEAYHKLKELYAILIEESKINCNFLEFCFYVSEKNYLFVKQKYKRIQEKFNFNDNEDITEVCKRLCGCTDVKNLFLLNAFVADFCPYNFVLFDKFKKFENEINIYSRRKAFLNSLEGEYRSQSVKSYYSIEDVDLMTGVQFEQFLAQLFTEMGYRVMLTKGSGDQGVDLIVEEGDIKLAIQAKSYLNTVGNSAVQQVLAGKQFYNADKCLVVTNSNFSESAKKLAKVNDVMLWNRHILKEKMEEYPINKAD